MSYKNHLIEKLKQFDPKTFEIVKKDNFWRGYVIGAIITVLFILFYDKF